MVNTNQYDIKIDFNATGNDHIFGRYSHAKQHNPTLNSFALLGTGFSDAPIDNYVIDWSHTFSSNLLNDVRFGVNHVKLHNGTQFDSSVGDLGTQLGIANANAGGPGLLELGFNGGNPSGPGTGVLTNVGSNGVQQRFQDAVIQASDALVMTHNRHVFHVGFEYWRDRMNNFYSGNSGTLGAIIFNGAFTSSDPTNGLSRWVGMAAPISTSDYHPPMARAFPLDSGVIGRTFLPGIFRMIGGLHKTSPSTWVCVTRPIPRGLKPTTCKITSISSQVS